MALIRCPTCRKTGDWLAGKWGLFCSERCKLIDLGKWLGEEHLVSEPLRPEHFAGCENLPEGTNPDQPENGA